MTGYFEPAVVMGARKQLIETLVGLLADASPSTNEDEDREIATYLADNLIATGLIADSYFEVFEAEEDE